MTTHNALAAVLTKSGSFQNHGRVKLARHLLNIVQLQKELNVYNYAGLTKAAAANQNKSERIKFAALLTQHAIEKQAFLGALLRGAGGLAARGIGRLAARGVQAVPAAINSMGRAAGAVGQSAGNAGRFVNNATLPMRARVQQGAANVLNMENRLSPGKAPSERALSYSHTVAGIPVALGTGTYLANKYGPGAAQTAYDYGIKPIAQAGQTVNNGIRSLFAANTPQEFAAQ